MEDAELDKTHNQRSACCQQQEHNHQLYHEHDHQECSHILSEVTNHEHQATGCSCNHDHLAETERQEACTCGHDHRHEQVSHAHVHTDGST